MREENASITFYKEKTNLQEKEKSKVILRDVYSMRIVTKNGPICTQGLFQHSVMVRMNKHHILPLTPQ